jgi:hypothetical protein
MRKTRSFFVVGILGTLALVPQTITPARAQNIALPPGVVFFDGHRYLLPEAAVAKNADAVRALIAAGNALGMVRGNTYGNQTHLTLGQSTHRWRVVASGTMNGQQANVIVDMDYRLPAVRQQITRADKTTEITVANGHFAWDESKPGIYSGPAKTTSADRFLQQYLLPPAVIQLGEPAAETIKVATNAAGLRELTIPAPEFNSQLKATLDKDGHVTHTEMMVAGKLYSGDYSDYQGDMMEYHVYFPHRITLKVNGSVTADLTVSEHWIGRYMVFPVPQQVASVTK